MVEVGGNLVCWRERKIYTEVKKNEGRNHTAHTDGEEAKGGKYCPPISFSTDSLEQTQPCTTTCPIYQLECQQTSEAVLESAFLHDSHIVHCCPSQDKYQCVAKAWQNILCKYSPQKLLKSCVN